MGLARGELAIAAVLVATGGFWVFQALKLPLKDGFAPSSGFLPLVFGVLLMAITVAAVVVELRTGPDGKARDHAPMRRSLVVLGSLVTCVATIPVIGFALAVALMTYFLYHYCEGHPVAASAVGAVLTSLALTVIFRWWLGVPLPTGPWGF